MPIETKIIIRSVDWGVPLRNMSARGPVDVVNSTTNLTLLALLSILPLVMHTWVIPGSATIQELGPGSLTHSRALTPSLTPGVHPPSGVVDVAIRGVEGVVEGEVALKNPLK